MGVLGDSSVEPPDSDYICQLLVCHSQPTVNENWKETDKGRHPDNERKGKHSVVRLQKT